MYQDKKKPKKPFSKSTRKGFFS